VQPPPCGTPQCGQAVLVTFWVGGRGGREGQSAARREADKAGEHQACRPSGFWLAGTPACSSRPADLPWRYQVLPNRVIDSPRTPRNSRAQIGKIVALGGLATCAILVGALTALEHSEGVRTITGTPALSEDGA